MEHRRRVLERERALAATLFTPPTPEERAEFARLLERPELLPDRQAQLPLELEAVA